MRIDPFTDTVTFLLGGTGDHERLGTGGVALAAGYAVVLVAGVVTAGAVWARDPARRTPRDAVIWIVRTLLGAMWFQGSLWKLPLPASGGLEFWTGEMAKYSAFPFHTTLVRDFMQPNLWWMGPIVWLTEIGLTVSLTLGLFTRWFAAAGVLFTLNLWVGLYRHPTEWPWTYVFIIMLHGLLIVDRGGESLGLDQFRRARQLRRRESGST